jgi:GNAT superfamily N-acetyltransferase
MTAEVELALAADRAVRRRAALATTPLHKGLVVRHHDLYDVHYLNAVLLDAGAPDISGAGAAAIAEQWLGDLSHRHVVFDDAAAGERVAAELAGDGWERGRVVLMASSGSPVAANLDPRARPISEAEMDALQIAAVRDHAPEVQAAEGLGARLVATQRRVRATTRARCFGAGDPGEELASMCTVLLDPDVGGRRVALLTEVGTRAAYRERGLARAVVLAAIAEAARWGAERIVVGADADDWPQLMYARLDFSPVARQVTLTRRLRAPSGSVSGGV